MFPNWWRGPAYEDVDKHWALNRRRALLLCSCGPSSIFLRCLIYSGVLRVRLRMRNLLLQQFGIPPEWGGTGYQRKILPPRRHFEGSRRHGSVCRSSTGILGSGSRWDEPSAFRKMKRAAFLRDESTSAIPPSARRFFPMPAVPDALCCILHSLPLPWFCREEAGGRPCGPL